MEGKELLMWIKNHPRAVRSLASVYLSDESLIDDFEQEVYYRLLNSQATFNSFSAYYSYCKKTIAELADKHFSVQNKYTVMEDNYDFVDPEEHFSSDNISSYYVKHLKKRYPDLLTHTEWRVLFNLVKGNRYAHFRDHENKITKNNFKRLRSSINRKLSAFDEKLYGLKDILRMKEEGVPIREIVKITGWSDGTVKRKIYYE